jgi:hypothetical protein
MHAPWYFLSFAFIQIIIAYLYSDPVTTYTPTISTDSDERDKKGEFVVMKVGDMIELVPGYSSGDKIRVNANMNIVLSLKLFK